MNSVFSFERLPPVLQDLSPAAARFCLNIKRFMEQKGLVLQGRPILVGFSGGADSTALLAALYYLSPQLHISLTAAHLDHALRPEAGAEAEACAAFCRRLNIPLRMRRVDRSLRQQARDAGIGLEDAGRRARRAFYASFRAEYPDALIALGHQNNDLAEDIVMRLVRGTGWPGLGGMPAVDEKHGIIRPLLYTSRADIEHFLSLLGLSWIEDASNNDPRFFRNRVRHSLLPLLLRENPNFLQAVSGLHRLAEIDGVYFAELLQRQTAATAGMSTKTTDNLPVAGTDDASEKLYSESEHPHAEKEIFFPKELPEQLPKALRLRLYKAALEQLGSGQALLSGLLALDAAWETNPEPTEHRFPGNKRALLRKRSILWKTSKKK